MGQHVSERRPKHGDAAGAGVAVDDDPHTVGHEHVEVADAHRRVHGPPLTGEVDGAEVEHHLADREVVRALDRSNLAWPVRRVADAAAERHVEHAERRHREREHDAQRDQAAGAAVPRAGDERDPDDRECERDHDGDVHVDDAREVDEPRATGEHQQRARGDRGEIRLGSRRPRRTRRDASPPRPEVREGRGVREERGAGNRRRWRNGRRRQRRPHRAGRRRIGRRRISGRRIQSAGGAGAPARRPTSCAATERRRRSRSARAARTRHRRSRTRHCRV